MQNIVEEIKNGNVTAFREFFEDYYPMLCVFAMKYLRDEEVSKDVAQETLLAYWEKRTDFNEIHQVKGFLYMVARNRCLNHLKREQINSDAIMTMSREEETVFEERYMEQETYLLVRKAIDALPPQMRTIIRYALEGMKNPEIAREMGIAEGTVHAQKKAAYRKLRDSLREHFYLLLFF